MHCLFKYIFLLLQVKHTQKRKKKLHRMNKETKRKKIANLHTYTAILTNIKLDTAVLIPYITVL